MEQKLFKKNIGGFKKWMKTENIAKE
jgi:hypothetical protein